MAVLKVSRCGITARAEQPAGLAASEPVRFTNASPDLPGGVPLGRAELGSRFIRKAPWFGGFRLPLASGTPPL
jgi:hypothetical protein